MKKQFAKVLSVLMALMMVVGTFSGLGVMADAHEHTDAVTPVVVAPRCNAYGFTLHECACGYTWATDLKPMDPEAHSLVDADAIEATCTQDGYAAGKVCEWCNEDFREKTSNATDHNMAYVVTAGTCVTVNEVKWACTKCGYSEDKMIPGAADHVTSIGGADGHDLVYVIVENPSYKVEVKGDYTALDELAGSPFKVVIDSATKKAVKKLVTVTGVNGKATFKCEDCTVAYEGIVVKPNSSLHIYEEKTYGVDTCTTNKYTWEECKLCGLAKDFVETNVEVHDFHTATDAEAVQWGKDNGKNLTVAKVVGNCTTKGYELLVCHNKHLDADGNEVDCNTFKYEEDETVNHAWGAFSNATCMKPAQRQCSVCKLIENVPGSTVAAHNYFGSTETVAPTCTTDGGVRHYCTYGCGNYELRNVEPALGHDWIYSCEDEECTATSCDDCTHEGRTAACNRTGCNAVIEDATCEEHELSTEQYYYYYNGGALVKYKDGQRLVYVEGTSLCNVAITVYKVCAAHDYEVGAKETYNCSYEEKVKTVAASAAGTTVTHDMVISADKAADCVNDGWVEYICGLCRDNSTVEKRVGANACLHLPTATHAKGLAGCYVKWGHKAIDDASDAKGRVTADCLNGGHTPATYCEWCGEKQSDAVDTAKNPSNHNAACAAKVQTITIPGTCNSAETTVKYYTAEGCCGAVETAYGSKNAANHVMYEIYKNSADQITGYNPVGVPSVTNHAYEAPTCKEDGNTAYDECNYCAAIVGGANTVIPATNHVGTTITVKAQKESCDIIGWAEYKICTACSDEDAVIVYEDYGREDTKTIAANGDITVTAAYVTNNGTLEGLFFLSGNGRIIPAHGDVHQITYWTEDALNALDPDELEALGDDILMAKAPTCSTSGLKAGTYCLKCDVEYKGLDLEDEEDMPWYIDELGHVIGATDPYDQWQEDYRYAHADCENIGFVAYYCKWCINVDDLTWDKVGEDFAYNSTVWFIDSVVQYFEHDMDNFYEAKDDSDAEKAKAELENADGNIIDATCTEDGYNRNFCKYCGEYEEVVSVIEATGHYYMNGEEKIAMDFSCTEIENYLGLACAGCGYVDQNDTTHRWTLVTVVPEVLCEESFAEVFYYCYDCEQYAVLESGDYDIVDTQEEATYYVDELADYHIPAVIVSYVAPTVTVEGSITYTCANCEQNYSESLGFLDGTINVEFDSKEFDPFLEAYESAYDYDYKYFYVANGDTVNVELLLNSVDEAFKFSALELTIEYDSEDLAFLGAVTDNENITIAADVSDEDEITVIIYAKAGELELGILADAFATLSFKVLGTGSADVYLDELYAYDVYGDDLRLEVEYDDAYVTFDSYLTGDVNLDGDINAGDLVVLMQWLNRDTDVELEDMDFIYSEGDIDKDGVITGNDAMMLKAFIAGDKSYESYVAMMGGDLMGLVEDYFEKVLPLINAELDEDLTVESLMAMVEVMFEMGAPMFDFSYDTPVEEAAVEILSYVINALITPMP